MKTPNLNKAFLFLKTCKLMLKTQPNPKYLKQNHREIPKNRRNRRSNWKCLKCRSLNKSSLRRYQRICGRRLLVSRMIIVRGLKQLTWFLILMRILKLIKLTTLIACLLINPLCIQTKRDTVGVIPNCKAVEYLKTSLNIQMNQAVIIVSDPWLQ